MAHYHTLLGQMLQLFSRFEFEKSVKETKTEYHARGLSSWNHFTSMLFGQLSGQDSLRGIEAGLATQAKSLYHLGIEPIRRSTLAYANKHRSYELFKKIFFQMLSKCQPLAPHQKFPSRLRRIRSKYPETGKIIVLIANNFTWSAATIAKIYKERWQIELFFKSIKQQLKVKSFVGTSKNALLSQLWIALIDYLLLSYLKFKSKFGWSIYTLSSILPTNFFTRRNLWDWLNAPFHEHSKTPLPGPLHLEFAFG